MRTVIQKVTQASVVIENQIVASINKGLLVLVGIEDTDNNVKDVDGQVLIVSQFTLHAATKKGNRPSYIRAARPEVAIPIYEAFIKQVETLLGKKVPTGQFGAMMQVNLSNDGPVTILIDTKNKE